MLLLHTLADEAGESFPAGNLSTHLLRIDEEIKVFLGAPTAPPEQPEELAEAAWDPSKGTSAPLGSGLTYCGFICLNFSQQVSLIELLSNLLLPPLHCAHCHGG